MTLQVKKMEVNGSSLDATQARATLGTFQWIHSIGLCRRRTDERKVQSRETHSSLAHSTSNSRGFHHSTTTSDRCTLKDVRHGRITQLKLTPARPCKSTTRVLMFKYRHRCAIRQPHTSDTRGSRSARDRFSFPWRNMYFE